jgi:2-C-methyl-D-erythritol 4-phosphate cytidylyltransferase
VKPAIRDSSAIVVAGGRGVRIGGTVPKQFHDLAGVPIYQYSLKSLLSAGIQNIVLVVPEKFTGQIAHDVEPLYPAVRVTTGGPRRQDSVASGFALVEETASIILIHDAARPFLPLSVISHVAEAASAHGAALAALPVPDTIKRSEDSTVVSSTVDRTGLYLAQTPQGFKRSILAQIVELKTPGIPFTDEAMAAEQIRVMPRLVPGSPFCLKITTPDDLVMAGALLGMLMEKGAVHADWSWLRHTSAR